MGPSRFPAAGCAAALLRTYRAALDTPKILTSLFIAFFLYMSPSLNALSLNSLLLIRAVCCTL